MYYVVDYVVCVVVVLCMHACMPVMLLQVVILSVVELSYVVGNLF